MDIFHMSDVISLIGLPYPPSGHSTYNIPCPCCDDKPGKKHLNINLKKDVFRCPRCGFSGGVFDLYAHYAGIPREEVREALIARLNVQGDVQKRTPKVVIKEIPECPLTDVDSRSATYEAFLAKLSLSSDHRQNLRDRGLTDDAIDRLGYKTTPVIGMSSIAKQLAGEGHYLAGVPGFYKTESGQWSFVQENRGILIPVRNENGQIQGLQIRRDNVTRRKFRWVSSVGKPDGCKAEGWVHLAGTPRPMILLTEGPMKADVIHFLTGQTVVAVPGVNALTHLERMLDILREYGVTKIMTAFDMDFLSNPHVQGGYNNLTWMLNDMGFQFGTYLWNKMGYKRQDVEQTKQYAKKFVRYKEGAEKYSLGLTKFQELAKEAKAVYKIDGIALVNCEIFEKFLESFREF